jgi:uncharacterized membrane protein
MKEALLTVLIGASPISELRGAIPIAVFSWGLPLIKATLLATAGNLLPVIPLLVFWNWLAERLSDHFYYFNRLFAWLSDKTQRNRAWKFDRWEGFAVFLVAAIPLPLFGAWTATLLALIFCIPIKKAAALISFGVILSGLIVYFVISTGSKLITAP